MSSAFKDHLFKLRNPLEAKTFAEALFGSLVRRSPSSLGVIAHTPTTSEVSEKKLVLESLERFAVEKLQLEDSPTIAVNGGEIGLKGEDDWSSVDRPASFLELRKRLTLAPEFLNLLFSKKNPHEVSLLFVTEDFRDWGDVSQELHGHFLDELLCGFSLKTATFFERMIRAMKLRPEEVCLYPVENDEKNLREEIIAIAGHFRPEVIITLGAKASQRILDSKDRLAQIHGQFFPRQFRDGTGVTVVPLFHPNIIESNQNMKKTAWADMQKIMRQMKKLQ